MRLRVMDRREATRILGPSLLCVALFAWGHPAESSQLNSGDLLLESRGQLAKLDRATNEFVVLSPPRPLFLAASADGYVFVADEERLVRVDPARNFQELFAAVRVSGLAARPTGGVIACVEGTRIVELGHTPGVLTTLVTVPCGPVAAAPDGRIFTISGGSISGAIVEIDLSTGGQRTVWNGGGSDLDLLPDGRLVVSSGYTNSSILVVDPSAGAAVPIFPCEAEQVAIDSLGRVVAACELGYVARCEPDGSNRETFNTPPGKLYAIAIEPSGSILVGEDPWASYDRMSVLRIDPDDWSARTLIVGTPLEPTLSMSKGLEQKLMAITVSQGMSTLISLGPSDAVPATILSMSDIRSITTLPSGRVAAFVGGGGSPSILEIDPSTVEIREVTSDGLLTHGYNGQMASDGAGTLLVGGDALVGVDLQTGSQSLLWEELGTQVIDVVVDSERRVFFAAEGMSVVSSGVFAFDLATLQVETVWLGHVNPEMLEIDIDGSLLISRITHPPFDPPYEVVKIDRYSGQESVVAGLGTWRTGVPTLIVVRADCEDQLDNDGDSLVDYPNDPGCAEPSDTDENDPSNCGDGIAAGSEACDDRNLMDGDGCSSVCAVEAGWSCTGEPSTCALLAPSIEVTPRQYDFGQVDLGTSSTQIVTISNTGGGSLLVDGVALVAGSGVGFEMTDATSTPFEIEPNATVDIGLVFTPSEAGPASATLRITSDDPEEPVIGVPIGGSGVSYDDQAMALLEFFDASVASGDLIGDGPGASASWRLHALRNMIEASGDLIDRGRTRVACVQLEVARRRTDGLFPPPDFASGSAAPDLEAEIAQLRANLGCNVPVRPGGCGLGAELALLLPFLLSLRRRGTAI